MTVPTRALLLTAALVAAFTAACARRPATTVAPPPADAGVAPPACDESLWDHVYPGDPRRFRTAKDRLQVLSPCIAVTGKIVSVASEADGDYHIRVSVDPQFQGLLNQKNVSGQGGNLVVEPVCMKRVTQKDTIAAHSCDNFQQTVYDSSMKGKQVRIVGAHVTDMEHGWNEIHPVTSITVIP
jgi:hypothetical protein